MAVKREKRTDPIEQYGADPFGSFNFLIEVDGGDGVKAMFTEATGLKGEVEVFEIKEGGVNDRTHKFPGRVSWGPITLKKGLGDSEFVREWWESVIRSQKEELECRKNVKISLLDRDHSTTVRVWNLEEAWPSSWQGTTLNAGSSELAIETLVLQHKGVTESKP